MRQCIGEPSVSLLVSQIVCLSDCLLVFLLSAYDRLCPSQRSGLLALKKCIEALNSRSLYTPYQDSKLTLLLSPGKERKTNLYLVDGFLQDSISTHSQTITSHHITPHHITSHHTTPHHITSHHITSHHITSHNATPNPIKPRHIPTYHTR